MLGSCRHFIDGNIECRHFQISTRKAALQVALELQFSLFEI